MFIGYIDPGTGWSIASAHTWMVAFLFGFFAALVVILKKLYGFARKHIKFTGIILLLIAGVIIAGVTMTNKKAKFNQRLVIVGIDGMSPDITEAMMREGKLPSLAQLMRQGAYQHLATTNPPQSPVAWAAIVTGRNPGKNGIYDFIVRDPHTYGLSLSITDTEQAIPRRILKTDAFWHYTSKAKIPASIITCPLTFPPDKIAGRMLAGMGVPDILGTEGTFTFYTSEPLGKAKDIGGNVFHIDAGDTLALRLVGPRFSSLTGRIENLSVPVQATFKDKDTCILQYQNQAFELKKGEWSGWKEVTFIREFKKMRGILKFYLVEAQPAFKLYISPINFDPRDPFLPISFPNKYSKELAAHIGLYHTQGMPLDTWAINEKRLSEENLLSQVNENFDEKNAMLDFELQRAGPGVLFCYFGVLDTVQHMFWRFGDPGHPLYEKEAPQEYKDAIETWYKKMDAVVGKVMQKLNKNDTLIVLSDHGFNTFRRAVHLNSWLRENGYLVLRNARIKAGAELLGDVDWKRTKAYAVGFGALYINQRGRERYGIVKQGRETELLKEEIARKLEQWKDNRDNATIIDKVYASQEIFHGTYAHAAPDLYVGFNRGYRASWQTALGGCPAELIDDNLKKWSGDHLVDPRLIPGVVFMNRKITKENPSVYDITPTILKIIGYTDRQVQKCGFDGTPLFE